MTKAELVTMDERFIEWLASPDSEYHVWEDKRFIIVEETNDCEVDIKGFDTLEELKEHAQIDEPVVAVFHLYQKKELRYDRKVVITISQ